MKTYHLEFDAIGTKWIIDCDSQKSKDEVDMFFGKIKIRVGLFEETYSRFKEYSMVSEISKKTGVFPVTEDAKQMLDLYFKLHKLTGGLFTPLMGKTLEDAGYDAEYSLVSKNSFSKVPDLDKVIKYKYPTLEVLKPVKLDFGACGKGQIIDIVGKMLEDFGASSFCVDAGGDILYKSKLNKPLRVGLEDPNNFDQAIGIVEITSGSICGSSGNRRKWGKYNHIINPKTFESPRDILSTWVVAKETAEADALSTCLFFVEAETLKNDFKFEYLKLFSDFSIEKSNNFPAELFGV